MLLPFFICPLFYSRLSISDIPQFSGEYLRSIIVHAKSGPTGFATPRCDAMRLSASEEI